MSSFIPDLAEYSVLLILAIFLPTLVYGAMSMYLGPSPNLFIIQAIALAAVTIKLARENLFNGVLFAAGASIFTAIAYLVPVPKLFIEGFSAILGPFISTLLSTVIEFFAFGLAIGAIMGLAGIFVSFIAGIIGFLLTAFIMIFARLSRLVYEATEAATSLFIKAVPEGVGAVLAPYFGGIVIAAPIAVAISVIAAAAALWLGLLIGMAITGLLFLNVNLILYGLASIFSAVLLRPQSIPVIDMAMDIAALILVPYVVPVLWTVGYALLSSRRYAHRGMYFIGISAAAVVVYAQAASILTAII